MCAITVKCSKTIQKEPDLVIQKRSTEDAVPIVLHPVSPLQHICITNLGTCI